MEQKSVDKKNKNIAYQAESINKRNYHLKRSFVFKILSLKVIIYNFIFFSTFKFLSYHIQKVKKNDQGVVERLVLKNRTTSNIIIVIISNSLSIQTFGIILYPSFAPWCIVTGKSLFQHAQMIEHLMFYQLIVFVLGKL